MTVPKVRDGWEYDDDVLYVRGRPMPSGNSNPRMIECVVASGWEEIRDLLMAALAVDNLDSVQVRVDLSELAYGYEGVCLTEEHLGQDEYEEAKAAARFIRRAGERLDGWAEEHKPLAKGVTP